MIGDGINDSPALSAADVGIAVSDGAQIAREIADVTIGADDLSRLVTLRTLGEEMIRRIRKNYLEIVGINSALILLGVGGMIRPTTSAMVHNMSTLAIGLDSMKDLLLYIARNLVEKPDAVTVTEVEGDQELTLELRVDPDDMGKVIGRQGRIAKEIRTLVRSCAQRTGQKVSIDIVD